MNHHPIEEQFKQYSRLTLPCHKANVLCLRWNPEGTMLASGGKDKAMHLHRVVESELVFEQRYPNNCHVSEIEQLCWNPSNPSILATASADKLVKIWDTRFAEPAATIKLKNENISLSWSKLGMIAVADKADLISLIDTRKSNELVKDQKFQSEIGELSWNRDDDLIFFTSSDGNIVVIDQDLQTILTIDAFASPCIGLRFDPTGKYFAVGSNDALATVWDAENLACIQAIDRPEWPVRTVSFSFDSEYIASGSEDKFIDISDISTGEQVAAIDASQPTLTLDFHPKEYILAYTANMNDHEYRDIGTIKVVGFPEERRRSYS